MRIIGEIPHPHLKITVFKLENKFNVAFETPSCIQTFKIKQTSELERFEDIKKLVNDEFISIVNNRFGPMTDQLNHALKAALEDNDQEEFDIII